MARNQFFRGLPYVLGILLTIVIATHGVNVSSSYNFTSQNFGNGHYPNNLYEDFIFSAPEGLHLLLNIIYVKTENSCDYLTIGNGNIVGEGTLLSYSGGPAINELRVLSNGTNLWVTFTTDGSVTDEGFYGIVEPVNLTSDEFDCGKEFNCQNGACVPQGQRCGQDPVCANSQDMKRKFTSDVSYVNSSRHNISYNGEYPCRLTHTEIFIAPVELNLLLTIVHMEIDWGDHLIVGNGNTSNERNIVEYTDSYIGYGKEIKVLSEGNMMWLTLTSDAYPSYGNLIGFIEAVNMTIDELDCGDGFDCQNGACITQRDVCDYEQNCANGADLIGTHKLDVSYVNSSRYNIFYNGEYPCRLTQTEIFIAPVELNLLLTIAHMDIDWGAYLIVGNGNISNERNIVEYTDSYIGYDEEIKVLSEGNMMWLTFISDAYPSYGNLIGFIEAVNMTIDDLDCGNEFDCQNGACIPQTSMCDYEQNCANGYDMMGISISDVTKVTIRTEISAPNFHTGGFPCHLQQEEIFIAPDGLHVLLTIDYLDTGDIYDFLKVGNGNITDERNVLQYSGGPHVDEIRVLSEGSVMWLTFESNAYYYQEGFTGFVEAVDINVEELDCGDRFNCHNGACIPQISSCDYEQNCANGRDLMDTDVLDVSYVNSSSRHYLHREYPCRLTHTEIFIAPEAQHLLLTITYLSFRFGDTLKLGNGNTTNERTILEYSDNIPLYAEIRFLSEENVIWMTVTSNMQSQKKVLVGFVEVVDMSVPDLDCDEQFNCQNGACIPQRAVCDNEKNCANGRDLIVSSVSDISYVNTSRHNLYHTGQHQCRLIQTEVFITSDELKLLLTIKYISSEYGVFSVGNGNISNERNVLNYPEGIANGNEIKVLSDGNMMWLTLTSNDYYNYGYYLGYVEAVNMTIDDLDCEKEFNCENGACIPQHSAFDNYQHCANGFDMERNVTSLRNVSSIYFDTGEYPCNLHQEEIFIAPDGLKLLLTIEYLYTQYYYDILTVGNGNITNERNILQYSGGPFVDEIRVVSEGNVMWLTFTSDGYHQYRGFSGYIEAVHMTIDELDCGDEFNCQNGACISQRSLCESEQNCANGQDMEGVTITEITNVTTSRNISSPNFDTGKYPCNLRQTEVFIAPDGLQLLLRIYYLHTEYLIDFFRVGNGYIVNERDILRYSGGPFVDEIRVLSEGSAMWLTLTTDKYDNSGGFIGVIETVNMTIDELDCGDEFNCQNGACISQRSLCESEQNCANGQDMEGVTITEITNVTASRNISSPNFDTGKYPCNLRQTEVFIAPDGLQLLLRIYYLHTEYVDDFFRVGNGHIVTERDILRYSGGPFDDEIRVLSEGSAMWLTLTTNEYANFRGFSGVIETVNMTIDELDCGDEFNCQNGACISQRSQCGTEENCANGQDMDGVTITEITNVTALRNISSPNFDTGKYPCSLQQTEVFIAPDGLQLLLRIYYLHTEYSYDFFRVGNGHIVNERDILRYSGGPFDDEIRVLSEGSAMWLTLTTNEYANFRGFSGVIETVNMTIDELDCGDEFNCQNGACISQRSLCGTEQNCANGQDMEGVTITENTYVNKSQRISPYKFDAGFYPCNLRQTEIFIAPDGYNLLLTIDYLNIEDDILSFGNGMIPNEQKALELSRGPYIDETVFLSQGNRMWFAFLSDNYNNGNFTGFTGSVQPVKDTTDELECEDKFNCQNGACIPHQLLCEYTINCATELDVVGLISSDVSYISTRRVVTSYMSHLGTYPCRLYQQEIFVAPEGLNILLTIDFLFSEQGYDYLNIGNGDDIREGNILEYSGGPFADEIRVLSNGTTMWLTFTTDYSVNFWGFRGFVEPVNTTIEEFVCGEEFNCQNGACISQKSVCDDHINCANGFDENDKFSKVTYVTNRYTILSNDGDNRSCGIQQEVFIAPEGLELLLNIDYLNMQFQGDMLSIGNGNIIHERILLEYSNWALLSEIRVLSDGGVMWISVLFGDEYSSFGGYVEVVNMTIEELDCGEGFNCQNGACIPRREVCSGVRNCANGADEYLPALREVTYVTSRTYIYSQRVDTLGCTFKQEMVFIAPEGHVLLLVVDYLYQSEGDTFRVGNGNITNQHTILDYTNVYQIFDDEITVLSEGRMMWLIFTYSGIVDGQYFTGTVEPEIMTIDDFHCGEDFNCQNGACIPQRFVCEYGQNCANGNDMSIPLYDVTFVKRRLDISSPTYYTGECGIQQEEFFIAPRGLQLLLAIDYVDTDHWGDVLKVGNGNISNEHTIFQYTGGRIVAGISVLSQGNMIWMTFTSDGYYGRGLSGYVQAVNMTNDGMDCGNRFNCENGACIPHRLACDLKANCANGRDEEHEFCFANTLTTMESETTAPILSTFEYTTHTDHTTESSTITSTTNLPDDLSTAKVDITTQNEETTVTSTEVVSQTSDVLVTTKSLVTTDGSTSGDSSTMDTIATTLNDERAVSTEAASTFETITRNLTSAAITTNEVTRTFSTEAETTTGMSSTTSGYFQRQFVVPVLSPWPSVVVEYLFGFMDYDVSNTTRVRIQDSTGAKYGTFYGGIQNKLSYSHSWNYSNTLKRHSPEFMSDNGIYLYLSIPEDGNVFLSYPIDYLEADYIIATSSHNTSTFIIAATEADTEVVILFNEQYLLEGRNYSVNVPLKFSLNDLESFIVHTPFDPTGTFVRSSKRVAILMDLRSNDTSLSCSSLFYLPPVSKWGYEYSFAASENNPLSFRVIAAYDGTAITMDPVVQLCNQVSEAFYLNAWEKRDFNSFMNCFISLTSSKPIMVLLNEHSTPRKCKTMVVPSTEKAKGEDIPVFVKAAEMSEDNLRVWVSNKDSQSLLIDNQTASWNVVQNNSKESVVVETTVRSGYHVISSCNANSKLLVILNKELYAAYDFNTDIFIEECPFEMLSYSGVQLTFRAATTGTFVNSTQVCGELSSNCLQPLAERFCNEDGWEEPVLTNCYTPEDAAEEIERIANTTVTEQNVDEVASDLALVTTQTEDLDVSEVEDVAESLDEIANADSSSPDVTESVVGTVNNLMEVDEDKLDETQGTSSVVNSLEQQVSNVQENPENFTDIQNNVGVQAVKLDPDITKAITFLNLPPNNITMQDALNADLSKENTRLYNDQQEVRTFNSTSSIYVPSRILEIALEAYPTITFVPISFFIYKDSRLFQTTDTLIKDSNIHREEIASQVIAATLEVDVDVTDLPPDDCIVTRFSVFPSLVDNEVVKDVRCVFWFVPEGSKEGTWSEDGCSLSTDNNETICICNHLTSFAVLVGIGLDIPPAISTTLNIITWIGSTLSIAGLLAYVITVSLIGALRQTIASQIHINLCLCLIAFYMTFLSGDLAKDNPIHCRNIATAIHYFCLTTMGWMTVEAVHMYLLFVIFKTPKVLQMKAKYFLYVSAALVYSLSLIPVLCVFFISTDQLSGYCFLPTGSGLYFGLLIELLVMVVFNVGVFSLLLRNIVFRRMVQSSSTRNKKKEMFTRMQQFVLFWVLLGLSWIFGFLAVIPNRKTFAFEILFCLFTSLEGFVLFIFLCAKNPEVKKAFKKSRIYLSEWSIERSRARAEILPTSGSSSSQNMSSRS
ncbi:uncharacterized protein [Apostichopus japonicus]|uniref:uncharacterized protein isoform X3 n=1 Tax=Stichopus japonicus TaxID=307972 RepID=UPI003AB3A1A3